MTPPSAAPLPRTLASEPTVSVIIPTWNRAPTLLAAVQSALAQEPPPLEILICDDGSSDTSQALVQGLGDARVRWLAGPHQGRPAIARNRGIAASRGLWLAFLDSDDRWQPGKLAAQLRCAERSGHRASCSNAARFTDARPHEGGQLVVTHPRARLTFWDLLVTNSVVCSSAMFHRSLLQEVGGFPEQVELIALEDYCLWLRIASLTDFDFVAKPLVAYRDEPAASVRSRHVQHRFEQKRRVVRSYLDWTPRLSTRAAAAYLEHERMRACSALRSLLR